MNGGQVGHLAARGLHGRALSVEGAENLCHLGICAKEGVGSVTLWWLVAGFQVGGRAMIFGLWA